MKKRQTKKQQPAPIEIAWTWDDAKGKQERANLPKEIANLDDGGRLGSDIPQLVATLKGRHARLRSLDVRLEPKAALSRLERAPAL